MDASCKIQGSIHVLLCLIHKSMCPGFWVHIIFVVAYFLCIPALFPSASMNAFLDVFSEAFLPINFVSTDMGRNSTFFNSDNLFVDFLSVHKKSVPVHPSPLFAYPLLLSVNFHRWYNNKFLCLYYSRKNTRFFRISLYPF